MGAVAPREQPADFAARRRALLARAAARGVRTVLVFGQGSAAGAGAKSHGGLRHLCGWDGHESASLLVIRPDGAHLLVGSPFMVPLARELRADLAVHDVRPEAWGPVVGDLLDGGPGTVGFAEMPAGFHARLGALAEAPALDGEAARLRLVKDPAELACHRAAAELCDLLFSRLGPALARRVPAFEVQLELEMTARRAGADYCRTWLTIAPQADRCRYWPQEAQRVPQPGDQVLLGIALTVDGHWGHGIRMGSIGPQRAEHRELVAHVEALLAAGLDALRPGAPLAGVAAAMEEAWAGRAIAARHPGLTRFRFGHGLGCSYEDPLLTDAFRQHFDPQAGPVEPPDIPLAPGMLFELHPNLFVPGLGGAALGEMVLVEADGPHNLLRFPRACVEWT